MNRPWGGWKCMLHCIKKCNQNKERTMNRPWVGWKCILHYIKKCNQKKDRIMNIPWVGWGWRQRIILNSHEGRNRPEKLHTWRVESDILEKLIRYFHTGSSWRRDLSQKIIIFCHCDEYYWKALETNIFSQEEAKILWQLIYLKEPN